MVRGGKLFKRFELKNGRPRPAEFEAAQEPDPVTGDCPGWVPVGEGREDRWHREALNREPTLADGTYELVGPKVQGNPELYEGHALIRHGARVLPSMTPRTFEALREFFRTAPIEGIVWHHPDGRMVKIKKKDFGFKR